LEFNFNKAIEASEKLDQDMQPLYNVMDEEVVAAAIKRIKKEGEVPGVMLTVFGKAKFLARDSDTKFKMWKPDGKQHHITILPYP
jgi:hypothetical protein